jgi:hypothetical protein
MIVNKYGCVQASAARLANGGTARDPLRICPMRGQKFGHWRLHHRNRQSDSIKMPGVTNDTSVMALPARFAAAYAPNEGLTCVQLQHVAKAQKYAHCTMITAENLRLMIQVPCTNWQINLASVGLVGEIEINANATSCLLPGHGNYSFQRFGLGKQPA